MTPLTDQQRQKTGEWISNNAWANPAQAAAKTAEHILTHLSEFLPEDKEVYDWIKDAAYGEETDDDQMLYARAALNSPYRAMYEAMKQERDALKDKQGFVRLASAVAEEASSTPEKAREYLEKEGLNVDDVIENGVKKIRQMVIEESKKRESIAFGKFIHTHADTRNPDSGFVLSPNQWAYSYGNITLETTEQLYEIFKARTNADKTAE